MARGAKENRLSKLTLLLACAEEEGGSHLNRLGCTSLALLSVHYGNALPSHKDFSSHNIS